MAHGLSVAFETLYAILIALSSRGVFILAVWSENVSAEEAASDDWLLLSRL